jgi:hypothetical protein
MFIVWGRVRSTLISDLKALLRNLPILGPSEAMLPKKANSRKMQRKYDEVPSKALTARSISLFAWIWEALAGFIRVFHQIA